MPLLSFPNELFYIIAEDLEPAELNFFCQTCRCLNTLLSPLLHDILLQDKNRTLMWGAQKGREPLVRLLLENGADVNFWDGITPLYMAVAYGHEEIVKFLLMKGANMDVRRGQYQRTALHDAASRAGGDAIVRLLIESGAKVDALGSNGMTPLHHAVLEQRESIVKLLLEKGCDVNLERSIKDQSTALHYAAYSGNEGIVKILLGAGANVSARSSRQITPLHKAAECGSEAKSIARFLIERGADVNAMDLHRRTPLLWAAKAGSASMVKLLLEKGSFIAARNKGHQTALHAAAACCYGGEVSTIGVLVEKGVDVNSRDCSGETPLHAAATEGVDEMIRELLKYGAEIEARSNDGHTALHYAASSFKIHRPHLPAVEALLENGADINAQDQLGRTALHMTMIRVADMVRHDDRRLLEPVIKLLLERGADTELKDNEGMTVSRLVADSDGYGDEIVSLFLEYSAKHVIKRGDHDNPQAETPDCR